MREKRRKNDNSGLFGNRLYVQRGKLLPQSNIKVEGEDAKESEDTCCGSFAERGDRCAKNVTGDAPKNIEVACCAANCVFNKEEKCSADHIGIAGGNACNCRETECASFCCG